MSERIDHPTYYGGDTAYEAIKVIEAWELGFCLGNTVKYIARAGKKGNRLEDLKKARWYLDREIANGERQESLQKPKEISQSNSLTNQDVRLRCVQEMPEPGSGQKVLGAVGTD